MNLREKLAGDISKLAAEKQAVGPGSFFTPDMFNAQTNMATDVGNYIAPKIEQAQNVINKPFESTDKLVNKMVKKIPGTVSTSPGIFGDRSRLNSFGRATQKFMQGGIRDVAIPGVMPAPAALAIKAVKSYGGVLRDMFTRAISKFRR